MNLPSTQGEKTSTDHEHPLIGNTVESPAAPPDKDPEHIEVNFHKVDATAESCEARHQVANLNKICACKGEGMPDDESEEDAEVSDDAEEDEIELNPRWRLSQNQLITPSAVLSFCTHQWERSGEPSKQLRRMRHMLCLEPSFNRLSNLRIQH